jgi:hypothetical protein
MGISNDEERYCLASKISFFRRLSIPLAVAVAVAMAEPSAGPLFWDCNFSPARGFYPQ